MSNQILAELTRLGAAMDGFVATSERAEHAHLQAFLASRLGIESPVDAFADPAAPCRGIVAVANGLRADEGGRSFLEIARFEDAEKVLGVFDLGGEDPAVYITELADALDESSGRARIPARARHLCSLAELLASMQRRPPAATGLTFERMKLAGVEFFRRGGRALLAGVINSRNERGLGVYGKDERWERVMFPGSIEATAWAGEHIVVMTHGEAGRRLHVLDQQPGGPWSTRLEAGLDVGGEPLSIGMVATRDSVIVWCQLARGPLQHIHAFTFDGDSLSAAGTHALCVEGMFADADRIWCLHRGPDGSAPLAQLSELTLEGATLRVNPGREFELPVRAIDQGRVISGNSYVGTFVVSVDGREIQRLSVPAGHGGGDFVEAEDGVLLVRASSVRGFVFDGNAYVPWFETEPKERIERVTRVGDILYANIRDASYRVVGHRVVLPPRPRSGLRPW